VLVPLDPHNQVSTADPQPASLKFDEKIHTHPKTLLHLQAPQLETAALEAQTHVQEAPDAHLSVVCQLELGCHWGYISPYSPL
jgi:hypothetical protein